MNTGFFDGYFPETTDILWELRMNNSREWYQANKERYIKYVHEPTVALADGIFEKMHKMDSSFDERPKVSRVHRDTRFTKNKMPLKECKWFFLRQDGSIGIEHDNPTYFFEVSPDWYRYGFGYWPVKAAGMAAFRKMIDDNPAEIGRLIDEFNGGGFFELEGDCYKKIKADGLPEHIADWYNRKNLTFIRYEKHEGVFYKPELLDKVFEGFGKLYPLYCYFKRL